MAGEYGEIDSRQDFFRMLTQATAKVKQLVAQSADATTGTIYRQLMAIEQWTSNGRTPTNDERESIEIGLIAVRELENTGDPTIDQLSEQLQSIHNYLEDWPSDDEAANATDDDYFEGDG